MSPTVVQLAQAANGSSTSGEARKGLSTRELRLLDAMVESIIPETDTPGASEAGVAAYINKVYGLAFTDAQRDLFDSGLVAVESSSVRIYGRNYEKCSEREKVAVLTGIAALHRSDASSVSVPVSFFQLLKELTIVGYYTSEIGATQELRYQAVQASHEQCLDLDKDGRAWFSQGAF